MQKECFPPLCQLQMNALHDLLEVLFTVCRNIYAIVWKCYAQVMELHNVHVIIIIQLLQKNSSDMPSPGEQSELFVETMHVRQSGCWRSVWNFSFLQLRRHYEHPEFEHSRIWWVFRWCHMSDHLKSYHHSLILLKGIWVVILQLQILRPSK